MSDFKANADKLLESANDIYQACAVAERLSSIDSRLWIYLAFYIEVDDAIEIAETIDI